MKDKNLLSTKNKGTVAKKDIYKFLFLTAVFSIMLCIPVFADGIDSTTALDKARNLMASGLTVGGVIYAVVGIVHIGKGLPAHDSNSVTQGIFQIIGGGMIAAGGVLLYSVDVNLSDAGQTQTSALTAINYYKTCL